MTDMKTIAEMHQKGFATLYVEKLKEAYTHDWYFKGWEKGLILVCFLWTVFSVGKWVWGVLT